MKRRYLILTVGFVAFAGIVLGMLAMLPPRPGVTKANFDRIENGMTMVEVEKIFGGKGHEILIPATDSVFVGFRVWFAWTASDGSGAVITFSHNGVEHKGWEDSTETILDRIRRWLHLH
jgi:hypothetical protein